MTHRQMSRVIAEKLMGWRWFPASNGLDGFWEDQETLRRIKQFEPFDNAQDALEVMEFLSIHYRAFGLERFKQGKWRCSVWVDTMAEEDTIPMAVSLAAFRVAKSN
jgi:hypothetical protein